MLNTTRDLVLPTAITGSYPRPLWFDASLAGRRARSVRRMRDRRRPAAPRMRRRISVLRDSRVRRRYSACGFLST